MASARKRALGKNIAKFERVGVWTKKNLRFAIYSSQSRPAHRTMKATMSLNQSEKRYQLPLLDHLQQLATLAICHQMRK